VQVALHIKEQVWSNLQKLKAWLIRQKDKFAYGNQFAQWGVGRWYVLYSDGQKSTTMYYSTACDYAQIFGGQVRHISDA